MLSVYYANTPVWRWLKSGALAFFGFFCWSGSNLLLSYRPEWTVLYYTMAYGFVLIVWGPLTHLVLVPLGIRLRRTAERPATRFLARQFSKINLTVFFAIVIVLGASPISPMLLDFTNLGASGGGTNVHPDLACTTDGEVIHCAIDDPTGIDHVVVISGDRELLVDEEPPFEFTVRKDELEEVVGQRELIVELRDAEGKRIRRYYRSF